MISQYTSTCTALLWLFAVATGMKCVYSFANNAAFDTKHYTTCFSTSPSLPTIGVLPTGTKRIMPLFASQSTEPNDNDAITTNSVLCDLQTFLRLVDAVPTGGMAKTVIQAGECRLNGIVETRRAKKLYAGDVVEYPTAQSFDVAQHVASNGYRYVYKPKIKKIKPQAKTMLDGALEFGGRYRSEQWRQERKERKAERMEEKKKKKNNIPDSNLKKISRLRDSIRQSKSQT